MYALLPTRAVRSLLVASLLGTLLGGCGTSLNQPEGPSDPGLSTVTVRIRDTNIERPYVTFNGDMILEGDMNIGKAPNQITTKVAQAAFITTLGREWPNGIIPYVIDASISGATRREVQEAIDLWSTWTALELVPRTTQTDFVTIRDNGVTRPNGDSVCQSAVGHQGGEQFIQLGPRCGRAAALHEIGHTIGLFHEHNRSDRDSHIQIDFANIDLAIFNNNANDARFPFERYPPGTGADIGNYDVDSIMHYSSNAFARAGTLTIQRLGGGTIGPNMNLSARDLCAVNYRYFRQFHPASATPAPADYDGDGKTDLSVKFDACEMWLIDHSANGFGRWDAAYLGYGGAVFHPVPADYDGDGKADLSVKGDNEFWGIDYSSNGLGGWDRQLLGYGPSLFIPVPADYDGDGKADLSVKGDSTFWGVDYASNGVGAWDLGIAGYGDRQFVPAPADLDGDGRADFVVKGTNGYWVIDHAANGFGKWDQILPGYGPASYLPVPADYDGDGKADLSTKDDGAGWRIDYASNGFGRWDVQVGGYGGASSIPLPGDYDGDGKMDLCVRSSSSGTWSIDFARDGFGTWNVSFTP